MQCKLCRNECARMAHLARESTPATRASRLVAAARSRAALKGLPFDLKVERVQAALERGCCEATGIPFNLSSKRDWATPSLDQKRAGQGYTSENTRVILFGLNAACGNWGEDRLLQIVEALTAQRCLPSSEPQAMLSKPSTKDTE